MSGGDRRGDCSLLFPQWLPDPVKAWIKANRDHPEHVAGADLIRQLATDDRAKTLWRELTKRRPRGFVYPARPLSLASFCDEVSDDEDERQGVALIYLFKHLLHIAISVYPAKTEADRAKQAEELRQRAVWLRAEAYDTDLIPDRAGGINWPAVAAGMRAKADVLHQAADALGVHRLVVPNARPNLAGLQTASRISTTLDWLFGNGLYRQSSAIAEMLTGEEVTFEQVRNLTRNHPAGVNFLRKSGGKSHG